MPRVLITDSLSLILQHGLKRQKAVRGVVYRVVTSNQLEGTLEFGVKDWFSNIHGELSFGSYPLLGSNVPNTLALCKPLFTFEDLLSSRTSSPVD